MSLLIPPAFPNKKKGHAVILGAGPTGLSTAWRLALHGWKVTVIEKEQQLGGHGGTRHIRGYDVDDGPHKLYPQVEIAREMIEHFVGEDLLTTSKKSMIYLNGKYIPFPFGIIDLFRGIGIVGGFRAGLSYAIGKVQKIRKKNAKTYTDYVVSLYGRYPHELVFRQVAQKLWGNPDWLDVKLAETRIISPSLIDLVKSLFTGGIKNKPTLSADQFYYPRHGLRQLWEAMWKETAAHGATLHRSTQPISVKRIRNGYVVTTKNANGRTKTITADVVVSTIPLNPLFSMIHPGPPSELIVSVQGLQATSLLMFYVVVNAPRLLSANWVFFPESKFHFGRLSEQKGFSEEMVPKDRTVLMVEIPFARREIQVMNRKRLLSETVAQLRETGVLKPEHKILEQFTSFDEAIYPKYDLAWKEKLDRILDYTDLLPGFYLNGRHGLFCYNNMDHSMEMGVMLADHIASGEEIDVWKKAREHFYEYRIVD
jgi:protoporphyrinogen oxidase